MSNTILRLGIPKLIILRFESEAFSGDRKRCRWILNVPNNFFYGSKIILISQLFNCIFLRPVFSSRKLFLFSEAILHSLTFKIACQISNSCNSLALFSLSLPLDSLNIIPLILISSHSLPFPGRFLASFSNDPQSPFRFSPMANANSISCTVFLLRILVTFHKVAIQGYRSKIRGCPISKLCFSSVGGRGSFHPT